jgi:AcrR family transcriptional regulator
VADAKLDKERRLEIGRIRRAKTRAKVIASAFELFGEEAGLFVRVEDITNRAGITRPTFYSHFTGLAELREALTYELTHDFLAAVTFTVSLLADPRERASAAIRFYLHRVQDDPRWAWSMINLSANGVIFGAETHRQAELTIRDGMEAGLLSVTSSAVGRDIVLGASLAAMATMLREPVEASYPELIVDGILQGMGVSASDSQEIVNRPLPGLQAGLAAPS